MQIRLESAMDKQAGEQGVKQRRPTGPAVGTVGEIIAQARKQTQANQEQWLEQLRSRPQCFAELELEVHDHFRQQADLLVAGLLAQASEGAKMDEHVTKVLDDAEVSLRPPEKKDAR